MARERYLHNAGEDTIHTREITPNTPQEKAENWWFYHKTPLLILFIAALVVFSIFYSIFSKVKPDYTISLITSYSMPENGIDELERCFAQYADDRNGDGKVVVSVAVYTFSGGEITSQEQYQKEQADLAKLSVDVATNDSMIFLHDEAAFESVKDDFIGFFSYRDGTAMPADADDFENTMIDWEEVPALASFEPEMSDESDAFTGDGLTVLYQRLRLSVRSDEGANFDEKTQSYYDDSIALLQRMMGKNE